MVERKTLGSPGGQVVRQSLSGILGFPEVNLGEQPACLLGTCGPVVSRQKETENMEDRPASGAHVTVHRLKEPGHGWCSPGSLRMVRSNGDV